jgi:dephospho-CoA kinase
MRVVGLTGSIGMGKSTTAAMFRARGLPVHDADRAVHRLYAGEAAHAIEALFPGVSDGRDGIDRAQLAARVLDSPSALEKLEAVIHPLVRKSEAAFLERARRDARRLVLLDIPLLFETGRAETLDVVVVVTAEPEVQRARVLARAGMSTEKFERLLARQLPDREKRRRAHYLVDSGSGLEAAERQVGAILASLAFVA